MYFYLIPLLKTPQVQKKCKCKLNVLLRPLPHTLAYTGLEIADFMQNSLNDQ